VILPEHATGPQRSRLPPHRSGRADPSDLRLCSPFE